MHAIVVGAGPAGLATAIALRRAGISVTVYERGDGPRRKGNGLTVWPNGMAALDSIGAGDAVRCGGLPAPGMAMRSASGTVLYEVSAPAMDTVGGNGIALHRADLQAALQGLLEPGTVRFGARCLGARTGAGRAVAIFADGTEAEADLVVGADGIRSAVRTAAGLGGRLRYGGFVVWRATIAFPLAPTPGLLSLGGDGQFGIWRLPGERVYWFASVPAAEGTHRRGRSRPPAAFARWHDPIPALLAATTDEQLVVNDIYDCRPLPSWSRGRIVLVGDAAHPSMPNMGQGTSQAFEDAAVLAGSLRSAATVEVALREYHARRRRRAAAAASQARMLAMVGKWRNPLACWARERMISSAPQRVQLRQLRQLFAFDQPGGAEASRLATPSGEDLAFPP